MRIVSVNVGQPRLVKWKNRTVETGIFKEPVAGRVKVQYHNIEGDRQADLSVHGGVDKAIYVYAAEYYDYWRSKFPEMRLDWGFLGENLTVEGLLDDRVNIGDQFQFGSVQAIVTQPRMPCYKLGLKFGRDEVLKMMLEVEYSGFYLRVLQEGEVAAGDSISIVKTDSEEVKVKDITRLYTRDKTDFDTMKRVIRAEGLTDMWRSYFAEQLEKSL